ncbi:phospho-N-acetylmuramoyl-pentapeptide-transferase [Acetobacterium wieringae]|uniref:Phospho-N-acetylmuramoyl-pentapeptide-transferase n=1 Tax=Acetobacterium wieringae TaxID=52694 RepID=A0ABY6HC89_9FIRM|nr:phospho-N-acetylmuramoyl-pentapeptide-transferase [Acetobacterium wieringae]UYO62097.1 phospho-N-acetylmuramoyl-pentapeptide-transferase [Acetobacterium wieringae]VUZ25938.1 Phospho-N-acetylmuramoyl-pentapeptide-transferase [Acetobacterium wieringae]
MEMTSLQTGLISLLVSFLVVYFVTPRFIPMLKRLKFGQAIREEGPQSHLEKSGTPTMGGLVIQLGVLVAFIVLSALIGNWDFFPILVMLYFGVVGFIDDYIKVAKKHNLGLRAWQKMVLQCIGALVIALYAYYSPAIGSELVVPLINRTVDFGIWYVPFTFFAVVAIVNAVNLTDGLDGLASGVTLIVAIFFFVGSLMLPQANTSIFIGAIIGGCLGFLRHNSNPADIFMGDTGSMALGGAIVVMAIITQLQIFLLIAGALFVIEALSVVIQVGYFKSTKGKRFFKMAPIHHHFELSGWSETRVVTVFWVATAIFVTIAFICLG